MRQKLVQLIIAFSILGPAGFAQSGPQNLDFEKGELGALPQGWKITNPRGLANPGYTAKLTHEQVREGAFCAELSSGDAARNHGAEDRA